MKVIFWIFVIALAFVNPVISFGLLILYYLPSIIKSACEVCKKESKDTDDQGDYYEVYTLHTFTRKQPNFSNPANNLKDMKSYSDNTLEVMK